MKVYILQREKELVCVCSSKEKAIECAEDDAADNLFFEDSDNANKFKKSLNENNHAVIGPFVLYCIKEEEVL